MAKLIEATHVSLGGEIASIDAWVPRYLDDQHARYATELLRDADALLLGRVTYEGLSPAYQRMAEQGTPDAPAAFIDRMNALPKHVATTAPRELDWNATAIDGDVAAAVDELKRSGVNLLKYGNGPLDATLMAHGLIDEFHLFLTPVSVGKGQHLFEDIDGAPELELLAVTRFDSGVLVLVYAPR